MDDSGFLYAVGLLQPGAGWLHAAVFVLVVIGLIVAASLVTGSFWFLPQGRERRLTGFRAVRNSFFWYVGWATVQQFCLFTLLYALRLAFPGSPWVVVVVALLFAAFHFPNWSLMFTAAALFYSFVPFMDAFHNLYAVGLAHALVAFTYERLTPRYACTAFEIWAPYAHMQRAINRRYRGRKAFRARPGRRRAAATVSAPADGKMATEPAYADGVAAGERSPDG